MCSKEAHSSWWRCSVSKERSPFQCEMSWWRRRIGYSKCSSHYWCWFFNWEGFRKLGQEWTNWPCFLAFKGLCGLWWLKKWEFNWTKTQHCYENHWAWGKVLLFLPSLTATIPVSLSLFLSVWSSPSSDLLSCIFYIKLCRLDNTLTDDIERQTPHLQYYSNRCPQSLTLNQH